MNNHTKALMGNILTVVLIFATLLYFFLRSDGSTENDLTIISSLTPQDNADRWLSIIIGGFLGMIISFVQGSTDPLVRWKSDSAMEKVGRGCLLMLGFAILVMLINWATPQFRMYIIIGGLATALIVSVYTTALIWYYRNREDETV